MKLSTIQSPFIQRAAPYLARVLNVVNIAMIMFSLVLFTLTWSASQLHTDPNSNGLMAQGESTFSVGDKTIGDNHLWLIDSNLGGGLVITDRAGVIKNKVSQQHYEVMLAIQFTLIAIMIYAVLSVLVLIVSNNFLRLVAMTGLIILVTLKFQTPFLFSASVNIDTPVFPAITTLSLLAFAYWVYNKWLLKNNHISHTLIAYASQSGSAMSLAKGFKKSLLHTCDVRCLSTLEPKILGHYQQVLFIASTYGDGQPPEKAQRFMGKLATVDHYDDSVNYSILALGDRAYPKFCAFGHQLEQLLSLKGAKSILSLVEVDRLDGNTIRNWWHKLTNRLNWQTESVKQQFLPLTVLENKCLNPSQTSRHAHAISFNNLDIAYQPGDLLEVLPERSTELSRRLINTIGFNEHERVVLNGQEISLLQAFNGLEWHGENTTNPQQLIDKLKPLSPRVYSIASSPYEDELELVVRRCYQQKGIPGVASNYLCDLTIGQIVKANIRAHSNFHLPEQDVPLILIGAGTGIAPLIGFLRHRALENTAQQHWLFFGEQHEKSDFYFADDIKLLQARNLISELSLAWSRDDKGSYIGGHIEKSKDDLLYWIHELDACIYVCGNRSGFGDSVCAVLNEILGQAQYEEMVQSSRLRTDLY